MNMKIGGSTPPVQPQEVGRGKAVDEAGKTPGGPALTVDKAQVGGQQAAGGPLGMEDLLPLPDFSAHKRITIGGGNGGTDPTQATGSTDPSTPTESDDLTSKVSTNTADSNAAVAAMLAAGAAMIQAQQTSAKAENTERTSDVSSYENKMDSAVSDLKDAASDAWTSALAEGISGIAGSVVSMAGVGVGAFSSEGSALGNFLGSTGEKTGMLGLSGNIISGGGKLGGAAWQKASTDKEGDEKTAEKFAGVFQSAAQNAQQYRDTFFQTQTSVIQALQGVVQSEGAALQSAASGNA